MDFFGFYDLVSDSDDYFRPLEEAPGPTPPSPPEAPPQTERTRSRLVVQPFRTLTATERSCRILNSYFSIWDSPAPHPIPARIKHL